MGAWAERHIFEFDGGRPALEFVNTMSGLRGVSPHERLTEYADLAFWAEQMGLIDRRRMLELVHEAVRHPGRSEDALAEAIAAREALYEVLLAAVEERAPDPEALETVNGWIAQAQQHRRLRARRGGGYEAVYEDDGSLLAFLRPIADDARALLEGDLGRVRRCGESEAGRCGWLFLDETRNHSRRYCTMADCGNRAKQRRFQERRRG